MRSRWLLILLAAPLVAACLPAYGAILAQNIFDEPETSAEPESSKPPKAAVSDADDEEKPVAKPRRRKKARKKKKSAPAEQAGSSNSDYSPAEVAKASYAWAPDITPLQLASTAPGIRTPVADKAKPANDAARPDAIEVRPAPQGFKLPQIPVTQVLIVAAFVILFLIYRFRVGRQMKRRKY